jgi:archaellum biogenesis ATPase FlaH
VILNGGLEPGAVVALAGTPGTGKTILAQQICFAAGSPAHKAVYDLTGRFAETRTVLLPARCTAVSRAWNG